MNIQIINQKQKNTDVKIASKYKFLNINFLATTMIFSALLYYASAPSNTYDSHHNIKQYGIANAFDKNKYEDTSVHTKKAGFEGPVSSKINTVEQATSHGVDKEYLAIEGHIINRVSKDKYTFKDNTGEVVLEIDEKYMPMEKITPSDKVRIFGKISKKILQSKIKIDVKKLEIIASNGDIRSYAQ